MLLSFLYILDFLYILQSLIDTVSYLITKCYFTVGNQVYKQDIGIPMGIDPAPFWANLLYRYEEKFVKKIVSSLWLT